MSDDPNTAAELFADDIMRIVMSRLHVQLLALPGGIGIEVVDMGTGNRFTMPGFIDVAVMSPSVVVSRR